MVSVSRKRRPYRHDPPFSGSGNPSAGTPVSILNDADHNGFPGVCQLTNDDLLVTYRTGLDHTTTDGNTEEVRSTDDGATWGSPASVLNNANDVRDQGLTTLSSGLVIRTWFERNAGVVTSYSAVSTTSAATAWNAAVTMGSSFTDYTTVSAPAVELSNGDLIVAVYGENIADTLQSIRLVKSTDDGASWADAGLVASATTFGVSLQEPNIALMDNGDLVCMVRTDNNIMRTYSTDSGTTWDRLTNVWAGYGRPSVVQRPSDGATVCMYRQLSTDDCRFRTSWDRGRTWTGSDGDFTNGNTNRMEYGQWVVMADNSLGVVYSCGPTLSNSDLFWNTLT